MAMNETQTSREMIRKQKQEEKEQKKAARKVKKQVRLIPIWAKFLIVFALMIVSLFSGAMIGYGVLGDGNALDVFKPSTWTHIYDLIYKK